MATFLIHEDMDENHIPNTKTLGGRRVLATITNISHNFHIPDKPMRCPLKPISNNVNPVKFYEEKPKPVTMNIINENLKDVRPVDLDQTMNCSDFDEKILEQMSVEKSFREVKTIIGKNKKTPEPIIYLEPLYRREIVKYLLEAETKHRPHPLYMNKQQEVSDGMRCILIDWLVSISDEYNFSPETLFLAVTYIDRFLSKMSVIRSKLQLVGVTAMMIAAKYEEIYPPDTSEFVFLTNDTYTVKQIVKMENFMLRALCFDLTVPTIQTFLDEYSVHVNLNKKSQNLAMFLSELCLVESVSYIQYLPSQIAASAIALSRQTLEEENIWPEELQNISGYTLEVLSPLIKKQHKVFQDSPSKSLQAVRQKFGRSTLNCVSNIIPRVLTLDE